MALALGVASSKPAKFVIVLTHDLTHLDLFRSYGTSFEGGNIRSRALSSSHSVALAHPLH